MADFMCHDKNCSEATRWIGLSLKVFHSHFANDTIVWGSSILNAHSTNSRQSHGGITSSPVCRVTVEVPAGY